MSADFSGLWKAASKAREEARKEDFGPAAGVSPSEDQKPARGRNLAVFGDGTESYSATLERASAEKKAESAAKRRQREGLKKAAELKGYLLAEILRPETSIEALLLQAAAIIGTATADETFVSEVEAALKDRARTWKEGTWPTEEKTEAED